MRAQYFADSLQKGMFLSFCIVDLYLKIFTGLENNHVDMIWFVRNINIYVDLIDNKQFIVDQHIYWTFQGLGLYGICAVWVRDRVPILGVV